MIWFEGGTGFETDKEFGDGGLVGARARYVEVCAVPYGLAVRNKTLGFDRLESSAILQRWPYVLFQILCRRSQSHALCGSDEVLWIIDGDEPATRPRPRKAPSLLKHRLIARTISYHNASPRDQRWKVVP